MIEIIITILSVLTLAVDLFLLILLLFWLVSKLQKKDIFSYILNKVKPFLEKYSLVILLTIPLIATLGSLFFSEIANYAPCKLCWYQRIFMYPQVVLVATALIKKSKNIISYIIPLSVIGGLISAYHYLEQVKASLAPFDPLVPCSLDGTSCAAKYFFHFGYITIPTMALSAFLLILVVSWLIKRK